MATEEPAYEVIDTLGTIEIRRYDAYVVAETTVEGNFNAARRQAFGRLFRFISGNNTRRQEIAMTTPVSQSAGDRSEGEKIAMTVPVFSDPKRAERANAWTMEFVMPPGATLEQLPVPRHPLVSLHTVPSRTVAAYRYSGSTGEKRFLEHAQRLEAALAHERIATVGAPVQAVYNGPFTIGPLRRNEAVVEVDLDAPGRTAGP
ncbi:MAG: heme-binding protein [Pseudomonadota bacterium]